MELPEIGEHCNETSCNRLDFLPFKCDACSKIFCSHHMNYEKHKCSSVYKKNVYVPLCPLCELPVPIRRNQEPDVAVSEHIDNNCGENSKKTCKKLNGNRCSATGCKVKEMIPVICKQCNKNYCLIHRFPDLHSCRTQKSSSISDNSTRKKISENNSSFIKKINGSRSEDEAFAAALDKSLKDSEIFYDSNRRNPSDSSVNSSNLQRCQVF
ncbi:arsenite inducuble RNA associated protein aip-1, putative [Pediculus humanus corporis]|uniref:Arsenite inducuble RNA associated protein aip-1, putative n=1 Tax=Pediculus humanus subsp. corporis TaxID=121224 RepID=E0W2A9_PEDHC|nr:arsenite inducuble RNA associated protein aip-1, putative [Pediculus humanus corporis]EEB19765.1 arsenite inducuble RNA associated protein aip-1, putative [Pediculus humanus corporis]